jgi:hypothetical protein
MILAERNARVMAEANAAVAKAEAANAQADLSSSEVLIAHLKLEIEKLRREIYGTRSERKARLLEQLELQLEDLACPIHQGSANFEVWRNFPSPAATIRGAARGARLDFIFIG